MIARLVLATLVLAACEHESQSLDNRYVEPQPVDAVVPIAPPADSPPVVKAPADAPVVAETPPDARVDPVPAPKVAFFEDKNRKVLDNIINQNLNVDALRRFTGAGTGTTSPAKVSAGSPDVSGSTTIADIDRVVRARLGLIKACYLKELANKPGLAGKVNTTFVIAETGEVSNATATGMDDVVDACIVAQIKRMKFPAPADGKPATIRYPFLFSSQ